MILRGVLTLLLAYAPYVGAAERDRTLTGFNEYKFSMTYDEALKSHSDHAAEECGTSKCITRDTTIYGFPATVVATFRPGDTGLKIVSVLLDINKDKSRKCADKVEYIVKKIVDRYGVMDDSETTGDGQMIVKWNFANGASIKADAGCATSAFGLLVIEYEMHEVL